MSLVPDASKRHDGVVLQEASVMTVFNNPQFSGVAGFSTINSHNNTGSGLRVLSGSTLTLTFAPGTASGNAGCNTFSGAAVVDGEQLTIGPLASTRMACTDQALSDQEAAYLAALENTTTFSGTSSMLTLLDDEGLITVTLARA